MPIFMEIEGIEGEAARKGFEKKMEIWSFNQGVSQSANPAQASAHSSAEAHLSEVSVTKPTDKATPILLEKCCDATHFTKITFSMTRTVNKVTETYMSVVLHDCIIASISLGVASDGTPTEAINWVFSKIEWTYGNIEKTGKGSGNTTGTWNIETGDREV